MNLIDTLIGAASGLLVGCLIWSPVVPAMIARHRHRNGMFNSGCRYCGCAIPNKLNGVCRECKRRER